MRIIHTKDYQAMSRQAAHILSAQVTLKPDSVLGLATGSTPIGIYEQLVAWYRSGDLDFSQVRGVNLDEYIGLDSKHEQSYRYFMEEKLFGHVNMDPSNVHIPNGVATDLEKECTRYDEQMEQLGGIDLQLLGIGHNGHIGFNEPEEFFNKQTYVVDLQPSTIQANARFFENEKDVPRRAITVGIQSIMRARKIVLVASGQEKKDIIEQALYGPITPQVPASVLQLHGDLTVVCSVD